MQRQLFRADRLFLGVSIVFLAGFSCTEEDTVWKAFNAESDQVTIEVTAADLGEAVTIDLRSTTGTSVVGSADVDPGSGPVGTVHRVEVHVDAEYIERVGKISVLADAGDRGSRTFSLNQDSADNGLWVVDVTSVGTPGEVRSDTFTFSLFEEVPATDTDT